MSNQRNTIDLLETSYLNAPDKIACIDEEKVITYRQLWKQSHIIAGNLIELVEMGIPVPVFLKKSCMTLQIIWGIIKVGGCYVIVDSYLPEIRIRNILDTLDVHWVIGEKDLQKKLPSNIKLFLADDLFSGQYEHHTTSVSTRINQICDIDPLYIMFTSGSTGVPKGIVVNHKAVIDFIECFTKLFNICSEDIIGNQAPWDFDVSVKDIFSAASVCATMQIIPKKYFSFPTQLVEFLDEKKVSTLIWAVSALCIISSNDIFRYKRPRFIEKIIFSGEVMPVKQYNIWKHYYPHALFVNVYGPTEITCNCTYHIAERNYEENEVIPIGKAFPNKKVFLLDDNNCLIRETESRVGEICVSGTSVAMGYYNNQEATQKCFVQNPLQQKYLETIYRTGDLGYYNSNRELCFSSRIDFQIKHLGHRIELNEIEQAVNYIADVNRCCCIYCQNAINLFYEGDAIPKDVIKTIRKKLPSYMAPENIIKVESIPINKNGKIDRQNLSDSLR